MSLTPFLRLTKPPFDSVPWDEAINGDLDILDGFIAQYMSVPNFTGSWKNNTAYTVGEIALDTLTSTMWRCEVAHTSSAAPASFPSDRLAHPTYWSENSAPVGYVPITGGTMTGLLTLSGEPVDPLDAATKAYADAGVRSWNSRTGAVTLASADVINALGYTPYSVSNPAGYQTAAQVSAALGPYYSAGTTDARYVFKAGDTITGGLNVNGYLTAIGGFSSSSGLFQVAPNYYLQRSPGDGAWRFVEGGAINSTLDPAGNLTLRGQLSAATGVYARSGLTYMAAGGSGVMMQFSPQWYWDWNSSTGQLVWITAIGGTFGQRTSPDHLTFNLQGTFGGFGPFLDMSDQRSKQAVVPTTRGLAEILQLNPVSFQRIMPDGSTRVEEEIGLIAQEVALVVPEVVTDIGLPLAEGAGTFESGEPSKAIAYSPLVSVLINAVKELNARIEALEAP